MRILVIVPWGERLGGAEEMLQMALDGARVSGHELDLVFLGAGPWADAMTAAGFHVEVIPAGRLRDVHKMLATIFRLASVLRRRQPDLVLNWSAKTHIYGSPAAIVAGMRDRVVWWQHGISNGAWLDRLATALPAIAIGCSSHAAAREQARLYPGRPSFVVAPGTQVPRGSVAEAPLVLPPGLCVIGVVGRLQPGKGQDRLLGAQALLRDRGREVHVVIVGGDAYGLSTQYAESLPALVNRLSLGAAVTLTGQVPDAGPYIEQMDILVSASDSESFGIVLLEAMARGVAVVAVDAGGPAELIEHMQTGVLAASGEPRVLADALEPLVASGELRRRIGQAGQQHFMRDFTAEAMCERFFHQLETLAARQSVFGAGEAR